MAVSIHLRFAIDTVHMIPVRFHVHAILLVIGTSTGILQPLPWIHCDVILQLRCEVRLERAIRPYAIDLLKGRW